MDFICVLVLTTCWSLSGSTFASSGQNGGACFVKDFLEPAENVQSLEERVGRLERELERQFELIRELKQTVERLSLASRTSSQSPYPSSHLDESLSPPSTPHRSAMVPSKLQGPEVFLDRFKFLSTVKTEGGVTALKTLVLHGKPHGIAGDSTGKLYVIYPSDKVIKEHMLPSEEAVVQLETITLKKNLTSVLTLQRNGKITLYKLETAKQPQKVVEVVNFEEESVIQAASNKSILKFHVSRFQRIRNAVFVMYETGGMDIFRLNGSLISNITLPFQILSLKSDANNAIFGHEAGIMEFEDGKRYDLNCSLPEDIRLKSHAFDVDKQSRAYGVTTKNEMIYFYLRRDIKRCYSKHRREIELPIGEKIQLVSVKGYLLLASDQGIGVYNTTLPQKLGPTIVLFENYTSLGTSIEAEIEAIDEPMVSAMTMKGGILMVRLSNGVIGAFESLLPIYEQHRTNYGWIYKTGMVLMIIGVVVWKTFTRKQAEENEAREQIERLERHLRQN